MQLLQNIVICQRRVVQLIDLRDIHDIKAFLKKMKSHRSFKKGETENFVLFEQNKGDLVVNDRLHSSQPSKDLKKSYKYSSTKRAR